MNIIRTGEECRTCGIPHDHQTHQATESIHKWLRDRTVAAIKAVKQGPRTSNRVLTPHAGYVPQTNGQPKAKAMCSVCGEPANARKLCRIHYWRKYSKKMRRGSNGVRP